MNGRRGWLEWRIWQPEKKKTCQHLSTLADIQYSQTSFQLKTPFKPSCRISIGLRKESIMLVCMLGAHRPVFLVGQANRFVRFAHSEQSRSQSRRKPWWRKISQSLTICLASSTGNVTSVESKYQTDTSNSNYNMLCAMLERHNFTLRSFFKIFRAFVSASERPLENMRSRSLGRVHCGSVL